jgi:4-amino-4-deoxy-L-arabinose transferase-like glycosyltransferase
MTLKTGASPTTRRSTLLILAIVLVGLVWLRTFRPMLLPMFFDEGLHLLRAKQVLSDQTLLVDTAGGKYLQVWLVALTLPFADDPLQSARILSAGIGLLAGIGCFLLTRHLYRRDDAAVVATALYAIVPYPLFFDRMALVDGLLSALVIWALLFSLLTVSQGRWWQTLMLGSCLGMAAATRLTGVIFLAFPLLVAWLWRDEYPLRRVLPRLLVAALLMVPWLLPSVLDFAPQYKVALSHSWTSSEEDGISHLTRLGQNLNTIAAALWAYLTLPIMLLALAEAGRSIYRRDKSTWLLSLAALVTLVFFFLTADSEKFYPRYILPAFPFLMIMAARSLVALTDWVWGHSHVPGTIPQLRLILLAGLVLLASLPALRFDYLLLTEPPRASWTSIDRWQYIDGWPAGYGIVDATAYLRQQTDELGVIIVVKRAPRSSRAGVWKYYLDHPRVIFDPINLRHADPTELIQALYDAPAPVFVALDRPNEDLYAADFTDGPYAPYSSLIATFPRPGGASRIEVYRVRPQP